MSNKSPYDTTRIFNINSALSPQKYTDVGNNMEPTAPRHSSPNTPVVPYHFAKSTR